MNEVLDFDTQSNMTVVCEFPAEMGAVVRLFVSDNALYAMFDDGRIVNVHCAKGTLQ